MKYGLRRGAPAGNSRRGVRAANSRNRKVVHQMYLARGWPKERGAQRKWHRALPGPRPAEVELCWNVNAKHSHHNSSFFTAFTLHLHGWEPLDRKVCTTQERGARSANASGGTPPRSANASGGHPAAQRKCQRGLPAARINKGNFPRYNKDNEGRHPWTVAPHSWLRRRNNRVVGCQGGYFFVWLRV